MSRRTVSLVAFALAASLVVLAPALGNTADDVVRLHLGSNGQNFTYGSSTQNLTLQRNTCIINSAEPLIDLSSVPTGTVPGLSQYALGVRSSGSSANGTPCSQTDSAETLKMTAGTSLAGRSFKKLRFDMEMTGNAVVVLKLYAGASVMTYSLQTGTSITADQAAETDYDRTAPYEVSSVGADTFDACAAPNSSGPNNAGNDNCLWTIDPQSSFDRIELTTSKGTASLEAGADFGNDPNHDSLFYLANSAPSATDDAYSTDEDITLSSAAPGVLGNDSDLNGDSLSAALLTGVSHGTLTLGTNGSFTYAPTSDYNGPDSFTYRASDGNGGTADATVTITVNAINDPPAPTGVSPSINEDTSAVIQVATDIDSTVINADCTSTAGGTWTETNPPNGSGTYTPPANFFGTDTLTCTVTDQDVTIEVTTTVSVGVTSVNDTPTAGNDTTDTDMDAAVTIAVLGNDEDGDPNVVQTLTVTNLSDPANGTAGANADGTVTYTPDLEYVGTDTFTYQAFDETAYSNTATVTVTVFETICTDETVEVFSPDKSVHGVITKIDGEVVCKRYTLEATDDGTIIFDPSSDSNTEVSYRAYLDFGPDPAPTVTTTGNSFVGRLDYDPLGGTDYRPMQWCDDPTFVSGDVTDATLPGIETWCIAATATTATNGGKVSTIWQVFGLDDPSIVRSR